MVKLEARSGWQEIETIEVGRTERRIVRLTADELGLTLAEGKKLLGEFARVVLQIQMKVFTICTCGRVPLGTTNRPSYGRLTDQNFFTPACTSGSQAG